MRILLVEDEVKLAIPLAKILEKNNLPTDTLHDGMSGYLQARTNIYDVLVLDIMLPEMNGLDILKKLRQEGVFTPVLLLTAKDSVEDKLTGFEFGADDYLTKPFSTDELIARIKALSRRATPIIADNVIEFQDLRLNMNDATVTIDGEVIALTAKESSMLELLIKNAGVIIVKEHLLNSVWGLDSEATDNTVEIYMHYLRKKISSSTKTKIITKRGLGYVLKEVKS